MNLAELSDNFKLVIEYDGTHYHGWQRQTEDRSIQGEIETALSTMTREKITLIGSGRTDAGVHATAQTANFHCETRLSPEAFHNGLNRLLPEDIVIRSCVRVSPEFHARYDVKSKIYEYTIFNHPQPTAIGRQYHWWLRAPLDIKTMQRAAKQIIGEYDFKAFEAAGSPRAHTVRNVMAADWTVEAPHKLRFRVQANGFLRYMVRNLVGTLIEIGRGKIGPGQMESILASRDRGQAAPTAPPQGLCLVQVNY